MKKVLVIITALFIFFIILVYLSVSSTDKEFQTCKIESFGDIEKLDFSHYDSVKVAASTLYKGNVLKNIMQGENYREAWATPVQVPIAFLDTLKGGMKIIKEGGGQQTHSLKLKGNDGITYTLRSITKDAEKLIPEAAETLGLENIIVDGISGQHPYGAVLAAELARLAGILHTHPQAVFIPKQSLLGDLNEKYGNRLYLLEYETESEGNWTELENVLEIVETDDLQELKVKHGENLQIDQSAFLRARLFDILIGDWDRHSEQWGWVLQENNNRLIAIVVPGDRDNAFFKVGGIIPGILTDKNIKPDIRPFEEEVDYMPGLVYTSDRYFLIDTPEELFIEEAEKLQKSLSDEKIDNAFNVWPPQISKLNKEEIKRKLISRRDNLTEHAVRFYEIIQEKGALSEPLKGSEDLDLPWELIKCFGCKLN